MAVIVFGTTAGNWSDDTKWIGGTKPTASDSAVFDASSANCIIAANAECLDLDCSTYASGKTLTHNASVTLTIYGSLDMSGGFTYTKGNGASSATTFASTSAGEIITLGGHILGNTNFNGSSGEWTLQDTFSANDTTVTNGSLITNDKTCTLRSFLLATGTKSITLGASVITCTVSVDFSLSTGLTFDCGTSSITVSGQSFKSGGKTFYDVTMTGAGNFGSLVYTTTFHNLTITPSGSAIYNFSDNMTVSNNFTVTGYATGARVLIGSNTLNSAKTITCNGTVSSDKAEYRDITGAGTASWDISANENGDCYGNSGITFTTGTNIYWVHGASASYNWDGSRWFTTSGGSTPARMPLPQDTAVFDSVSFGASGKTVALNWTRLSNINATNATNSPTFSLTVNADFLGDIALPTAGATFSGGLSLNYVARGVTKTITSAGNLISNNLTFYNAGTGTLQLADALNLNGYTLAQRNGTFNSQGYSVTCGAFLEQFTAAKTATLTNSSITLTGSGAIWDSSVGGTTLNASGMNISATYSGAVASTIKFASGQTFQDLTLTRNVGGYTLSGAFTARTLSCTGSGAVAIVMTKSTTYTMTGTDFFSGTAGNLTTITTNTAGTSFTLSKSSGTVDAHYVSLKDSAATGGATFNAYDSTNVSGNSGWNFLSSTLIKAINGLLKVSVKTVNSLAIASVKTWNGLS